VLRAIRGQRSQLLLARRRVLFYVPAHVQHLPALPPNEGPEELSRNVGDDV
jgi:hypothetical protein